MLVIYAPRNLQHQALLDTDLLDSFTSESHIDEHFFKFYRQYCRGIYQNTNLTIPLPKTLAIRRAHGATTHQGR